MLRLPSYLLEFRRMRGELIEAFRILMSFNRQEEEEEDIFPPVKNLELWITIFKKGATLYIEI